MFGSIFQNNITRKVITSFGSLFTNITVVRYNDNGSENERFVVPIQFGQKEKYQQAIQGDPMQDKHVQVTVPIIAYNIMGMKYDAERKQISTIQNFNVVSPGNLNTNYMSVPYNYDFEVYVFVRTLYDGFQILEQILPFFTPDYTLKINLMPTMNITKDVPLILDRIDFDITEYEGQRDTETRYIQFTLSFTAKAWLFGPVKTGGVIKEAITNIWNWCDENGQNLYLVLQAGGTGDYKIGEIVYQNSPLEQSNASALVVDWSSLTHRLLVTDVEGTFITNETLIGSVTGAEWNLINYEIQPQILETITITPDPANANAGQPYTYNVSQQFFNTSH